MTINSPLTRTVVTFSFRVPCVLLNTHSYNPPPKGPMFVILRFVVPLKIEISILGSELSRIEPSKDQLAEGRGTPSNVQDKARLLSGIKVCVSLFIDEASGGSKQHFVLCNKILAEFNTIVSHVVAYRINVGTVSNYYIARFRTLIYNYVTHSYHLAQHQKMLKLQFLAK